MKRNLCVLGSTGSIGTQTLKVVEEHQTELQNMSMTAGDNIDLFVEQILK